ncbi:MAG: hypothetical protein EU521_00885, partial [Promethearchaeota archaeon]
LPCLRIKNTNKYFSLQNCSFLNGKYGVYFSNISNAYIENSKFLFSNNGGVKTINCVNLRFEDNLIANNSNIGLEIAYSTQFLFLRNNITFNHIGTNLTDSTFMDIKFNYYKDSTMGVFSSQCSNIDISFNQFYHNNYAIYLSKTNFSFIRSNTGEHNNFTIIENDCILNTIFGNFPSPENDGPSVYYFDFTILLIVVSIGIGIWTFVKFVFTPHKFK